MMNVFKSFLLLWAAAPVWALRRKSRMAQRSTMAGRVIGKMIAEVEVYGVNVTLSNEVSPEVVVALNALAAAIPKEQTDSEKAFCESQEDFSLGDLERAIKDSYTRAPFTCLDQRHSDLASSVFGLFNVEEMRTQDPMENLVANCMFQDLTEQYGGSGGIWSGEGFEWTQANLKKFPGLKDVGSLGLEQATEYSNMAMKDASTQVFPMLAAVVDKLTRMYPSATTEADKKFIKEKLKKMYLIFFFAVLVGDVEAGSEDLGEAMHLRRAVFYDNVEWAVNYERFGVASGAPGADPDNIHLGEQLLQIYRSCYFFEIAQQPPQLRLKTPGNLLARGVLLYTLWNYRYVQFFVGQDAVKSSCEQVGSSQWKHAPWVALHALVALGGPMSMNQPDFSDWPTHRIFALNLVGAGMQQTCDGSMEWTPTLAKT